MVSCRQGGPGGLICDAGHEGDLLPSGGPGGLVHHTGHEGDLLFAGEPGVLVHGQWPGGVVSEVVLLGVEGGLVYIL